MKKALSLILAVIMAFSVCTVAFAAESSEKPFDNSNFFCSGEYTLHYRTYEPAAKAKGQILLVHGFCLSTASLEGIAEEYQRAGYFVVTVDAPDFGYSTRETLDMTLVDRESLIFALMEDLGGEWILGGHSMGGGIALNIATDHPEKVKGLVLYAPQSVASMPGSIMKVMVPIMGAMCNLILKLALKVPALVRMLVEMSFSDSEYAKNYDLSRISDPMKLEGTGTGVAVMTSHARAVDFNKVSELKVPSVVITAKEDKVANADNLQQIIDALGENVVTYECEKGGHMMMEYNPQLVAEKTLPTIALCR
ncbi:MAG: alpha/beta hydrolase [Acutalibacteraceae bacterium]|nr:alpha/beta hydrolase [Acutalibacteraceae bacterium]